MKSFLVIGLGRFGRAVACELGSLGHEVLALDNSEENVQHIADSVTQAICGDAQDEAVLRSLGVGNFDCCVVAIGTDIEASILITVMLKELGAKQVVCKALSALHARVLERVGADRVIQPEREIGQRLAQHLGRTNVIDYIGFSACRSSPLSKPRRTSTVLISAPERSASVSIFSPSHSISPVERRYFLSRPSRARCLSAAF